MSSKKGSEVVGQLARSEGALYTLECRLIEGREDTKGKDPGGAALPAFLCSEPRTSPVHTVESVSR